MEFYHYDHNNGSNYNLNKMSVKEQVFNNYIEHICREFGITEEQLFTRARKHELILPRQCLYYLCWFRPMQPTLILELLEQKGYKIYYPALRNGVDRVSRIIQEDADYRVIIHRIQEACATY